MGFVRSLLGGKNEAHSLDYHPSPTWCCHMGRPVYLLLCLGNETMNYVTRAIMALLKIDADIAIRVQSHMDIDFSECTKAQMNREIRAAYAYINSL